MATMKKIRTGIQIGNNPRPENIRMKLTNRRMKISPPAMNFEFGSRCAAPNWRMNIAKMARMTTQKSADEV